MAIYILLVAVVGFVLGIAVGYFLATRSKTQALVKAQSEARALIKKAEKTALEEKSKFLAQFEKERRQFEKERRQFKEELGQNEKKVKQREDLLEKKKDELAVQLISRIDELLSREKP